MRMPYRNFCLIASRTQLVSRLVLAASSLALIAFFTACGGGSGSIQSDFTLTVYSGRSATLVHPIFSEYAEDTGADLLLKYRSTSKLIATLQEQGGKSPADVFFSQDPVGLKTMEEMFTTLPDSILAKVPDWARSSDGKWVGVSGRARVVVYNTDALEEVELPGDIWGFVHPKWKGRIGFPPTNASFQAMVTGMREIWGEDKTRDWLKGIHANDPAMYAGNGATVAAVGAGEVEVGFVNHYYLYRLLEENGESFPVRNYHLRDGGPGALVTVAGVGILKSSKHKEAAEQFIDFMLSDAAQQYFATQSHEYPLTGNIPIKPGLVPFDEINQASISLSDLPSIEGTQRLLRETHILP